PPSFLFIPPPPRPTLFPYTTLFRSYWVHAAHQLAGTGITLEKLAPGQPNHIDWLATQLAEGDSVAVDGNVLSIAEQDRLLDAFEDRKSTRLNSSHVKISYAVFCLKK